MNREDLKRQNMLTLEGPTIGRSFLFDLLAQLLPSFRLEENGRECH